MLRYSLNKSWHFQSMDELDLDDFQYGGVNMTGFTLVRCGRREGADGSARVVATEPKLLERSWNRQENQSKYIAVFLLLFGK